MTMAFEQSLQSMRDAWQAYEAAAHIAWLSLLNERPEVRVLLESYGMEVDLAEGWFCSRSFDDETKTAIEMYGEARGAEVAARIAQNVHGIFA